MCVCVCVCVCAVKDLPVATGGAGPGTGVDRTARQQRKKHAKGAGSERCAGYEYLII